MYCVPPIPTSYYIQYIILHVHRVFIYGFWTSVTSWERLKLMETNYANYLFIVPSLKNMQMFSFFNLACCQSASQIVFVVLIGISQSSEPTMVSHCRRRRISSYQRRWIRGNWMYIYKFPLPCPLQRYATIHILLWHGNDRNEIYHLHKIYLLATVYLYNTDKQSINRSYSFPKTIVCTGYIRYLALRYITKVYAQLEINLIRNVKYRNSFRNHNDKHKVSPCLVNNN